MLVSGAWGARNQHFKISGVFFAIAAFFLQYLAALAAKYMKNTKNTKKIDEHLLFFAVYIGNPMVRAMAAGPILEALSGALHRTCQPRDASSAFVRCPHQTVEIPI